MPWRPPNRRHRSSQLLLVACLAQWEQWANFSYQQTMSGRSRSPKLVCWTVKTTPWRVERKQPTGNGRHGVSFSQGRNSFYFAIPPGPPYCLILPMATSLSLRRLCSSRMSCYQSKMRLPYSISRILRYVAYSHFLRITGSCPVVVSEHLALCGT